MLHGPAYVGAMLPHGGGEEPTSWGGSPCTVRHTGSVDQIQSNVYNNYLILPYIIIIIIILYYNNYQ
jgi:hypothetical protein